MRKCEQRNNPATRRQVRRKMEEENKKARRVARREYNDALRELTVFVKKRDKRVAKVGASWALGCLFACSHASADVCV